MAIVYKAEIKKIDGVLKTGHYRSVEFETIDDYLKSLSKDGYEVEARPHLHKEVEGKANGSVYGLRKKGTKRWTMIALTRRKGSKDVAPKSTNLNIRISLEEKAEWEAMAKMHGMSFASWIRWCLNCHTPQGHQRVKAEVEKARLRQESFDFSSLPE